MAAGATEVAIFAAATETFSQRNTNCSIAESFARFEPVMNADGSIRALRFVFPPYQVAPYVEGTRTVDVPARVLVPLVAPAFKALFRAG